MDFMLGDDPICRPRAAGSRGSTRVDDRYGKTFVGCTAAERSAVLDAVRGRPKRNRSTPRACVLQPVPRPDLLGFFSIAWRADCGYRNTSSPSGKASPEALPSWA